VATGSPPAAGTLADSNVLLDLFSEDPRWSEWSETQLAKALDRGPTLINPIIYAEISIRFEQIEQLQQALPAELEREPLRWEAAFLAGKCFAEYRRRGGRRRSSTAVLCLSSSGSSIRAVMGGPPAGWRVRRGSTPRVVGRSNRRAFGRSGI